MAAFDQQQVAMSSQSVILEQLIDFAVEEKLALPKLEAEAIELAKSTTDLLDLLSLEIARRYAVSAIGFENADRAMNCIFALVCTEEFMTRNGQAFPEITNAIFQAFDEGEYYHSQDAPDDNPEEKYTKPMISEVLQRYGETA